MIKEVIIISKTHLDIGFTDLAENVRQNYMNTFLQKALKLSDYYRNSKSGRNFKWTVGSWLIYEFIDKLPPDQIEKLDEAIYRGDLTWHALPFTMHCELNSEFMFKRSLDISKFLDQRYNRKTTAAKMTDVPGHTKGIIAPITEAGVQFLHIGINPASAAVELPEAFNWIDLKGNSLMVVYQKDYGEEYLLPDKETLLYMDVTGDNLGPRTIEEMEELYDALEAKYPYAKVRCGSLNEIAERLLPLKNDLPVVTDEIGDTWIHGVATDPRKVACFKELCRWREQYGVDERFNTFDFNLLQISEHTWGMDEKTHLNDYVSYLGNMLNDMQNSEKGKLFEESWNEQRKIIDDAVDCLDDSLKTEAKDVLKKCKAIRPKLSGFKKVSELTFHTSRFSGSFAADGSISELKLKNRDLILADSNHSLFQFTGEVFGQKEYDCFFKNYIRLNEQWAVDDFTKPGLPGSIKKQTFQPEIKEIFYKQDDSKKYYTLKLEMESSDKTGMPKEVFFEYSFSEQNDSIELFVSWFGKFPARIAHAINLACKPAVCDPCWQFSKLGEDIDFIKTASKGARSLHAVDEEILCKNTNSRVSFKSLHAPLVAPGENKLLKFDNQISDMKGGIHYNLYNNIWGTNFPMWYKDDTKFQFQLKF